MSEKTVEGDLVAKALSSLNELAKGFTPGKEILKEVETKKEPGAATQIFHTPSNSEPASWAGSSFAKVSEDDAIDGNGTDYNGNAAVVKSILEAVAKGHLAPEAAAVVLKGLPFGKKDEDKDDDKEDKKDKKNPFEKGSMAADIDEDKKVEKSLVEDPELQKGFEVSEFLTSLCKSLETRLAGMEGRIAKHVDARLSTTINKQEGFNKSLTEALVSFGEAITVNEARVSQVERQPAHAPKSVSYINKSFGSAPEQRAELSKDEISKSLVSMVEAGQLNPLAAIKFESVGEISQDLMGRVVAHRAGK